MFRCYVNCNKVFSLHFISMFPKVMSSLRLSAPGTRISFDARNNRIEIIELSFFENSYDAISKETKFMESTNEIYKIDTAISAFSYKYWGSRVKWCVFNDNITFRYSAPATSRPAAAAQCREQRCRAASGWWRGWSRGAPRWSPRPTSPPPPPQAPCCQHHLPTGAFVILEDY